MHSIGHDPATGDAPGRSQGGPDPLTRDGTRANAHHAACPGGEVLEDDLNHIEGDDIPLDVVVHRNDDRTGFRDGGHGLDDRARLDGIRNAAGIQRLAFADIDSEWCQSIGKMAYMSARRHDEGRHAYRFRDAGPGLCLALRFYDDQCLHNSPIFWVQVSPLFVKKQSAFFRKQVVIHHHRAEAKP